MPAPLLLPVSNLLMMAAVLILLRPDVQVVMLMLEKALTEVQTTAYKYPVRRYIRGSQRQYDVLEYNC